MIRDTLRILSPTAWIISAIMLVVLVVVGWWLFTEPGRQRQRAAEARAEATLAEGRTKAASDAVGVVVRHGEKAGEIQSQVKGSQDAIRNAAPADRDGTALRELCKYQSYRNHPDCVQ